MRNKLKEEFEAAESFSNFYSDLRLVQKASPVKNAARSFPYPDFFLPRLNLQLEIKSLCDRQEMERDGQWAKIIARIKQGLASHPKRGAIRGSYLLDAPWHLEYKCDPQSVRDASERIVSGVMRGQKEILLSGGVKLRVSKVSEENGILAFGSHGGGFFDPARVIHENITEKIVYADKQIGNGPRGTKGSDFKIQKAGTEVTVRSSDLHEKAEVGI